MSAYCLLQPRRHPIQSPISALLAPTWVPRVQQIWQSRQPFEIVAIWLIPWSKSTFRRQNSNYSFRTSLSERCSIPRRMLRINAKYEVHWHFHDNINGQVYREKWRIPLHDWNLHTIGKPLTTSESHTTAHFHAVNARTRSHSHDGVEWLTKMMSYKGNFSNYSKENLHIHKI